MTQNIILLIPLYFFLFISQNSEITASSLAKSIENEEHLGIYLHDELIVKRNRREVGRTLSRETKSNYLKKLYEGFYKYKTSKKLNHSLSNSWGAGGMPFNVLYAPNAYQKKILKSMLKKAFVSVEDTSRTLNEKTKQIPEVYDLVLQDDKPPAKSEMKASMKINNPRKYYSLIPQLFVSYGW